VAGTCKHNNELSVTTSRVNQSSVTPNLENAVFGDFISFAFRPL